MNRKQILETNKVNAFLSEYTTRNTIRQHKNMLSKYFTFNKKNPDTYIKDVRMLENGEKFKTLDGYEQDISKFRNWLVKEEYSPKMIHNAISSVKMFLEHYKIDLSNSYWKKLRGRGTDKVAQAISEDIVPTQKQVQQILTHSTTKPRAMFLLMASSGMRIGEVCNLKLSDIDLDAEYPMITLRDTKNRTKAKTFCSPEAKEAILEWMKIREGWMKTQRKRTKPKYWDESNNDKLFGGTTKNIRRMFKDALEKANLDLKDTSSNYIERDKIHPHCLRKYFVTQFSKYNNDLAKYLANQERTELDKIYNKKTIDELAGEYEKGLQHLLIFQSNVTDERLIDLEEENKKLKAQIEEINKKLDQGVNVYLYEQLQKLKGKK